MSVQVGEVLAVLSLGHYVEGWLLSIGELYYALNSFSFG